MTPLARIDIRTRMWLALGMLALAVLLTGAIAWRSLDRADTRLQDLHTQTLDGVAHSIRLSRQAADIAAVAPYLLSFETSYLIEREGQALMQTLTEIQADWPSDARGAGLATGGLDAEIADMETALAGLVASATAIITHVDSRQRIEAGLRRLEAGLYERSGALDLPREERATVALLLAMARELAGAASAQSLLGVGEHHRSFLRLRRELPTAPLGVELTEALEALDRIATDPPGLFELRRLELNSRLAANSALFRIGASASRINGLATEFARQSEDLLSQERASTATSIAFSKALILLTGLASVVLALLSAAYVSNYVTGNIKAVAVAMTRLAGGDRGTRLGRYVTANDEIGQLFNAFRIFRSNAERLDRSYRLLNEKNALFESVFSNITDGVAITGPDGCISACNDHVAHALRLSSPPRPGDETVNDLLVRSPFADALTDAHAGELPGYEDLTNAAGQTVELRSSALPDGGRVWLLSDATERRQLQDRLRRIEHIEALGKVSGEVAHDFGNVLSSISTNLHLISSAVDPARRQAALDGAAGAIDMGTALIERLLAFARRQPLSPEIVEVGALIAGMEDLISIGLGSDVGLRLDLPDRPAHIRVDPGQLESALLNLCLNASQSMADGGEILVTLSATGHGEVSLSVADQGCGIPREMQARVFDPFFTTREAAGGTGLGLSMVYGFVRQSGGDLTLDSTAGEGTKVTLTFPAADPAKKPVLPRPKGVALLVEDNDTDLHNARRCLEEIGYTVETRRSLSEAQAAIEDGGYALLLTDLHLGDGALGSTLLPRFRRCNPTAPAIIASGRIADRGGGLAPTGCQLSKPLTVERLARAITRATLSPPQ